METSVYTREKICVNESRKLFSWNFKCKLGILRILLNLFSETLKT